MLAEVSANWTDTTTIDGADSGPYTFFSPEPHSAPLLPGRRDGRISTELEAFARQRHTGDRSCRTGSTMSIDWVVPKNSTTPGRFKRHDRASGRITETGAEEVAEVPALGTGAQVLVGARRG
ncbi:hypothetical protein DFH94DRAFT_683492 [Russula ochroleuca]|uniref:Uncharacterized protein n=1 Tax=Russula ochroleuca TaxID=152965 RepID=A0A9P5MSM9_9AGAM|nr:hypothetical protein DFH94DRAFT_683492 [Russula ochroleuca]